MHFAAGRGINNLPAVLCVQNTEFCFDPLIPSPLAHQPMMLHTPPALRQQHKVCNCARQSTGVTQAQKQLSSKKTQTTDTAFTENGKKNRTTKSCAPKSRKLQLPEFHPDLQAGTEEAQSLKFTHEVTSKIRMLLFSCLCSQLSSHSAHRGQAIKTLPTEFLKSRDLF